MPLFGKVPDYEVLKYDNDFPALTQNPPEPDPVATDFFKTRPSYGKCEVILYSPGHTATLQELSDGHLEKLVNLWCERFEALSADEKVKYVFPFENRGDVVGVTMPHPHGQIYAYSYVPKKLELETAAAREYYEEQGSCLFCVQLKNEIQEQKRLVFQNEYFTVFLPFYTEYPYGVQIIANRHVPVLTGLTPAGAPGARYHPPRYRGHARQPVRLPFPLHDVHAQRPGKQRRLFKGLSFPHRILPADAQRG